MSCYKECSVSHWSTSVSCCFIYDVCELRLKLALKKSSNKNTQLLNVWELSLERNEELLARSFLKYKIVCVSIIKQQFIFPEQKSYLNLLRQRWWPDSNIFFWNLFKASIHWTTKFWAKTLKLTGYGWMSGSWETRLLRIRLSDILSVNRYKSTTRGRLYFKKMYH